MVTVVFLQGEVVVALRRAKKREADGKRSDPARKERD